MTFLSFVAGLLGVMGAAGVYFKWFAASFSFYLIFFALAVIALNLPISILGFIRLGKRGISFLALLFGLLATGALGFLFKTAIEHPLTDISNQPINPPSFRHPAASIPAPGMEDFIDPSFRLDRSFDGETAEKVKRVYPDLRVLFVGMSPEHAIEFVKNAVERTHPDWRVVNVNGGNHSVEIEVTHPTFNTVEDFAIEAVVAPYGSQLHMRSRSRFGFTDFGSNAKRIRDFSEELITIGRAMTPPVIVEFR